MENGEKKTCDRLEYKEFIGIGNIQSNETRGEMLKGCTETLQRTQNELSLGKKHKRASS